MNEVREFLEHILAVEKKHEDLVKRVHNAAESVFGGSFLGATGALSKLKEAAEKWVEHEQENNE